MSQILKESPARRAIRFLTASLIVGIFCVSPAVSAADLDDAVRRLVRQGQPKGSSISVSIRDLSTGAEVSAWEADRPLIPASNMKVLTTGAALVALGPEFRFRTTMRLIDNGDRPADLLLVGDGDPAFADPSLLASMTWNRPDGSREVGLDCGRFVSIWTDAVTGEGVRQLGMVIADDRIFEPQGFHPEWPQDQRLEPYCAEVWGLNFHHNLMNVWTAPVRGGAARVVRTSPDFSWIPIRNRTTSDLSAKAKQTFWIERPIDSNALTLNGNVRVEAADPVPVTMHDTPALLAELVARRLRSSGVAVEGARRASDRDPRGVGRSVGPPVETPLEVVLRRANTDSNNLSAECLLKRVAAHETGPPGSWASGSAVIPAVLGRRVKDPMALRGLVVSDGSGLSRGNRVTARLMTAVLAAIDGDPAIRPLFRESLAIGGETGTVRNRFKGLARGGCTVLCKTGYIRGVSCLSGLVVAPDGRTMAFSVLGNGLAADNGVGKAKELQEKIVEAIADELTKPRAALGG